MPKVTTRGWAPLGAVNWRSPPTRRAPAGTLALVFESGSTVTLSPGAMMALPRTSTSTVLPGAAITLSATAIGAGASAGEVMAIRTMDWPMRE